VILVKYVIPLIGSGTLDDPIRPKYRPVKEKKKIQRGDKTEEMDVLYPVRIDLAAGIAILETDKPIKELEEAEDVKRIE